MSKIKEYQMFGIFVVLFHLILCIYNFSRLYCTQAIDLIMSVCLAGRLSVCLTVTVCIVICD